MEHFSFKDDDDDDELLFIVSVEMFLSLEYILFTQFTSIYECRWNRGRIEMSQSTVVRMICRLSPLVSFRPKNTLRQKE